jgi:phospholipase C
LKFLAPAPPTATRRQRTQTTRDEGALVDPLDEQTFVVNTINALEQWPFWGSTVVIIAYDDSDGWYDHVIAPIVKGTARKTERAS